jgi:hypothetical protein
VRQCLRLVESNSVELGIGPQKGPNDHVQHPHLLNPHQTGQKQELQHQSEGGVEVVVVVVEVVREVRYRHLMETDEHHRRGRGLAVEGEA